MDRRFFTHNRVAMLNDTKTPSPTRGFSLEDIKGAAATVLIAGNDTASPFSSFHLIPHLKLMPPPPFLDGSNSHALGSLLDAKSRCPTKGSG